MVRSPLAREKKMLKLTVKPSRTSPNRWPGCGILQRAHTHQNPLCARRVDQLFFPAQLSRLLPAEHSSEVSQKYEHKGLFPSQVTEKLFRAVLFRSLRQECSKHNRHELDTVCI
ncbi:MAG: hypothetical protein WB792_10100 [Desulfobacterales bacterium]